MGQFAIVISGTGGHGCDRGVKDGEHVLGCQRPDCPDCIAREMVRRLRRNGVQQLQAELAHWPDAVNGWPSDVSDQVDEYDDLVTLATYAVVKRGAVIDDLVTGVRTGSF